MTVMLFAMGMVVYAKTWTSGKDVWIYSEYMSTNLREGDILEEGAILKVAGPTHLTIHFSDSGQTKKLERGDSYQVVSGDKKVAEFKVEGGNSADRYVSF